MQKTKENLILVGFMGTGKTTVGKILAERMGRPFVDLDDEIEARAGKTIAEVFEVEGEAAFRQLESEAVQEVSTRSNIIIACGGGVVLNADNLATLEQSGRIICLTASPGQILARIAQHTHRPLLEGEDRANRLKAIYDERKPLYDALPLQVDTDGLGLDEVAGQVERLLNS